MADNLTPRRDLRFDRLEQVVDDARFLLAHGYRQTGKWNLGQICQHLSDWMSFPVHGFPPSSPLIGGILWMMKVSIGKSQLKKILAANAMRSGQPTMPSTVPAVVPPEQVHQHDRESVERLAETVRQFLDYQGPIHPSPLFGEMDHQTCEHLQRVHCAHHLAFLRPEKN